MTESDQQRAANRHPLSSGYRVSVFLPVRRCLLISLSFLIFAISGCASGPQLSTIESYLKPPASEHGRIYFYRSSSPVGAMVQPSVRLNGEIIGSAVPGGVFFADRPAGSYVIAVETEAERSLSLNLEAGQVRYVRLDISMGFLVGRITPSMIDSATGEKEVAGLAFVGGAIPTLNTSTAKAAEQRRASVAPNRRYLSTNEIRALMPRVWEFERGDDGNRVRWEFWGATLYGANLTYPGRYSADWRFNERGELCVFWTTRRSIDRCVSLARDGEQLVMIDSKNPDVVFATVELK